MNLRVPFTLRRFACVALVAAALSPSAAFADQTKYFECVVGWSGEDSASVVVGIATSHTQQLVNQSAAACGYLISTGLFRPADKYFDYDSQFDRACVVHLDSTADAVVWAGTDSMSQRLASTVCSGLQS